MHSYHQPVLIGEVACWLKPTPGGVYLDGTLGGAGHSEMILERSGPDGKVLGIDRDPEALKHASARLSRFGDRFESKQGNFADMQELFGDWQQKLNGILLDLGVSSHQIDTKRGFSFLRDEPLDMRMDAEENIPTALDVVNRYRREDLERVLRELGEEKHAARVARAIIDARPVYTTGELAKVIRADIGRFYRAEPIDPCTRSFMAIRVEVNQELESVGKAIPAAVKMLAPGGRLVVISFHSLEDRIVKNEFRRLSGRCLCAGRLPECRCGAAKLVKILTSKPVVPEDAETRDNARARSAKLRCVEKLQV